MSDVTALAQASVEAAQAVVDALAGTTPPEPPASGPFVLHGSSSQVKSGTAEKAFTDLEASLVAASGQSGPVLMFDHRYNGDTIDSAIPSWWKSKGLRFG